MRKFGIFMLVGFAIVAIGLALLTSASVNAAVGLRNTCAPEITLLNQDPYPAVPGDYVKVVFQITGLEEKSCGTLSVNLVEGFPFSLEPGEQALKKFESGYFVRDFSNAIVVPYKLRVDKAALDGENELDVVLSFGKPGELLTQLHTFNITIEANPIDFDVFVKDFDNSTNLLTLQLVNVGEGDAEAVVVEIPKQSGIEVKGARKEVVGSLDAHDDTTTKFEALPRDSSFNVSIYFNDELDNRLKITKEVEFDRDAFLNRRGSGSKERSPYFYATIVLAVLLLLTWMRGIFRFRRRRKH
ncbi:hypothetical protein D6817_02030 [Candidatus Pacearchaeota archaeon]|nr:MAG: hypothetical protein D6817_02030 [Candidatus Pacearchaeota archaeon]